jgi:hypothetical protein
MKGIKRTTWKKEKVETDAAPGTFTFAGSTSVRFQRVERPRIPELVVYCCLSHPELPKLWQLRIAPVLVVGLAVISPIQGPCFSKRERKKE